MMMTVSSEKKRDFLFLSLRTWFCFLLWWLMSVVWCSWFFSCLLTILWKIKPDPTSLASFSRSNRLKCSFLGMITHLWWWRWWFSCWACGYLLFCYCSHSHFDCLLHSPCLVYLSQPWMLLKASDHWWAKRVHCLGLMSALLGVCFWCREFKPEVKVMSSSCSCSFVTHILL